VTEGTPSLPEDDPAPGELEVGEASPVELLENIDHTVGDIAQQMSSVEFRRLIELVRRGSYAGPLPPPEILEGYKAAYPDAPAIVFNELVQQGSHRRGIETTAINRQERRADRGQIFALGIVVLVLAVCVLAVLKHEAWIAGVLFGTTLLGIVGTFVYGTRRQVLELGLKRRRLDSAPRQDDEELPGLPPDSN